MHRTPLIRRPRRLAAAGSLAGALLLGGALGACGSSEDAGGDPGAGAAATTAEAGGAATVAVRATDAGCLPETLRVSSGPTTFEIGVTGTGKAMEFEVVEGDRVLGEREDLQPGATTSLSLDLAPGAYEIVCPGADRERGRLVVTRDGAQAASTGAAELQAATVGYATYVEGQAEILLDRTRAFVAAVKAGDVAEAKRLFPLARQPWERIEPVAESFGDLDPRVDARVNDVAPGEEWTGFHRIEQALWKQGSTAGMKKFADTLLADVQELVEKVEGLEYQPAQLANGATELLGEVSKSKITGEEDRYSHTDLYDFEANVDGAREAFELLAPALDQRDAALRKTIDARFEVVFAGLDEHREGDDGFVSYTALSQSDVRTLSQQIDALAEPLSRVAATVVGR